MATASSPPDWCNILDSLNGVIRRLVRRELEDDLVQEVAMRLCRRRSTKPVTVAYVIRIARNCARDLLRGRLRREAASQEYRRLQPSECRPSRVEPEFAIDAWEILLTLDRGARSVVAMRLFDDLAFSEIAARVGRSKSAVWAEYSRVMSLLRSRYAKQSNGR